jgi:hypothetical protein
MVQVIAKLENPQGRLADQLGLSLGQGLGTGINTYFANKALEGVINDKSNANASPSEKLTKIQSALAPYGELGRQLFGDRLKLEQQAALEKKEKENHRLLKQEQGVLGRYTAGEQLSAEDFAALSPKTQMALVKNLHQQQESNKKITAETLASTAFSKGYKAIIDNDLDSLKDVISDPNTPLNVKTQLGSIQNQFAQRADVKGRDVNRRIDSVQNAYRKAISAERNRLGKYGGYRPEEVKAINEKIAVLESSRDKDMQKLLKNPDNYSTLSIWGNPEVSNYLPNDINVEEDQEDQFEDAEGQEKPPTVKFDSKNEAHVARALQVLRENGNDRAAANKILAKEFSL